MEQTIIEQIAKEHHLQPEQIYNTLELLEEGSTVPFIARYRKERTKGLDEEQIRVIQEQYEYQVHLSKRKEEVLERIETLGKLDDTIKIAFFLVPNWQKSRNCIDRISRKEN